MNQLLSVSLLASFILVSAYARDARLRSEADEPGVNVSGQKSVDPGITQTRVLGEVAEIDAAGKRLVVKTEAGNIVTVMLDEKTEFLRVPPGEKSLEKAVKTTLAEIVAGDKVYVRGKVSEDRKSVPAQKLIVMPRGGAGIFYERAAENLTLLGNLSSPLFGESVALASGGISFGGGGFGGGSGVANSRRIDLQLRFSF